MRTVGKIHDDGRDEWIVVFDDGTPAIHVDLVTELSEHEGIISMSFASVSKDGDGIRKADVSVRLRMKADIGWSLCRSLKALEGGH